MRITVTAMGLGLAALGIRAGVDAFRRGSLPQIPLLMAATTKALVESLPATPATPASAQQGVSGPSVQDSGLTIATTRDSSPATIPAPVTTVPAEAVALTTTAPAAASVPVPVLAPPSPLPLVPVVAEGRTDLAGGMFVIRSGDTVTVYFDTPEARTRRPDKFEQIVRATLPVIHGAAAEALLASVPPGALIGAVDLVNELPTRGLHLLAGDGRALSLWPETRLGRDGLLVVAYRAIRAR